MLIAAMRAEAHNEAAQAPSDQSRRILWGMEDALGELERRIRLGRANLHWAQPIPRQEGVPLAVRDSQSPAPESSHSTAPSPDHAPAHAPAGPRVLPYRR